MGVERLDQEDRFRSTYVGLCNRQGASHLYA